MWRQPQSNEQPVANRAEEKEKENKRQNKRQEAWRGECQLRRDTVGAHSDWYSYEYCTVDEPLKFSGQRLVMKCECERSAARCHGACAGASGEGRAAGVMEYTRGVE